MKITKIPALLFGDNDRITLEGSNENEPVNYESSSEGILELKKLKELKLKEIFPSIKKT